MGKHKFKKGVDDIVGPTRKESANLMRIYNKANKNNPNVLGVVDAEEFDTREKMLKNLTANVASKVPVIDKKNLPFAGPSNEESKNLKIRYEGEKARKDYEDKQLKSSFQSDVLGKSAPTLKNMSTKENPILYKEDQTKKTPITYKAGDFNSFSAADKKKYREGIASGKAFSIGDREYAAASKDEQAFSAKMDNRGNKLKLNKQTENYKPKVKYTKPESLTDITRKQILTPAKKSITNKPNDESFGFNKDNKILGSRFTINPASSLTGAAGMLLLGGAAKYGGKLLGKLPFGKMFGKTNTKIPKSISPRMSQAEYDAARASQYNSKLAERPQLTKEQLKIVDNRMKGIEGESAPGVPLKEIAAMSRRLAAQSKVTSKQLGR